MNDERSYFDATRSSLTTENGATYSFYSLPKLSELTGIDLSRTPFTVKVFLENLLRNGRGLVGDDDVRALAAWDPAQTERQEFPYLPARVILQDFTGVPVVVDLAAMRSAAAKLGADPEKINPLVQTDLVIDHSVQVDFFGSTLSFGRNVEMEYQRNGERYALLRWGQKAFHNFNVVPPGTGIIHQVNLEFLAKVVQTKEEEGGVVAYPDTLVGTDSHTTMINGLSVLGWGVGGIEAEAVQLGQPLYMLTPQVVGFKFTGALREGTTATDLVLTVTQMLRARGVVDQFVEFYGPGISNLSLADRATISNMSPEYGATSAIWPVDEETLSYLRMTGRPEELVQLVEAYAKQQDMFRTDESPDPRFNDVLELDLSTVEPSVAGPRRPQDRVPLGHVKEGFHQAFADRIPAPRTDTTGVQEGTGSFKWSPAVGANPQAEAAVLEMDREQAVLDHGSVVIAAITSCTNTSNPSVMIAAGLLAKKAVERGLSAAPYTKTSLAPGSQVVTGYLENAGLMPYLEALKFHVVGYGCTTCIGNSGSLSEPVSQAVQEKELVVSAVLSGNRNFEGRINPLVRAAYLAAPPLVVAYAIAGTVDKDLTTEPLGYDPNGEPVYLRDVWPTQEEVNETMRRSVTGELFTEKYANVFAGDDHWKTLPVPEGNLYEWEESSTYVQEPPYFVDMPEQPGPLQDVHDARVLVFVGDSVTTDHISPAGSIARNSPAGQFLMERGVQPIQFNSYGARRGNHEVMMRGTFANIRLRNKLTPDKEGNWSVHLPDGEVSSVYDTSMRYQQEGTPLVILAGKEYGTGSSRDWAAKGTLLLGVKAVIAESFERIHRSNLVGMGVLPLQFQPGESAESLGLTGRETFTIEGISAGLKPRQTLQVRAAREDGSELTFDTIVRIDSPMEVEYYRHGGILPMVLRHLMHGSSPSTATGAAQ